MYIKDFDIFDDNYTKKIKILAGCSDTKKILQGLCFESGRLYLTSHNNKYQIEYDGILKNDSDDMPQFTIKLKQVDEFSLLTTPRVRYYAYDNDIDNGINLTIKNLKYVTNGFSADEKQLYEKSKDLLNEFKGQDDLVILTDAFILAVNSQLDDDVANGIIFINKKMQTRCSLAEIEEILDIKEPIKTTEITSEITK